MVVLSVSVDLLLVHSVSSLKNSAKTKAAVLTTPLAVYYGATNHEV